MKAIYNLERIEYKVWHRCTCIRNSGCIACYKFSNSGKSSLTNLGRSWARSLDVDAKWGV